MSRIQDHFRSSGYKRLPCQDDLDKQQMDIMKLKLSGKASGSEESEKSNNSKVKNPLVVNLNQIKKLKQKSQKTIQKVKNPLYNVSEYISEDLKNANQNNSNNKSESTQRLTSTKTTTNRNNSFLNILSRTIRHLISSKNSKLNRVNQQNISTSGRKQRLQNRSKIKNLTINKEIIINLGENNDSEVELKMRIPRDCFTNSDLERLNDKKCVKLNVSSSESSRCETSSSTSSCDDFVNQKPAFELSAKSSYDYKKPRRTSLLHEWDRVSSIDEGHIPLYHRKLQSCSARNHKKLKCILVVFVFIILVVASIFYFKENAILGLDFPNSLKNWSSIIEKSKTTKHKLHFWLDEKNADSGISAATLKATRQARNNSMSVAISNISATIATNSNTIENWSSSLRLYDRLSILINHELLKNLNFKYLLINETIE